MLGDDPDDLGHGGEGGRAHVQRQALNTYLSSYGRYWLPVTIAGRFTMRIRSFLQAIVVGFAERIRSFLPAIVGGFTIRIRSFLPATVSGFTMRRRSSLPVT